jgi:hypothetical protein
VRAWAIGVSSVVVASVLGGISGASVGPVAGVVAALAGLVAPPLLGMAAQRGALDVARAGRLRKLTPPLPEADGDPGLDVLAEQGVAWLLRPEADLVGFRRRPELTELVNWCESGGRTAVRLITGPGGVGKTRLALQLCQEMGMKGWQPLWVRSGGH